MQRHIMAGVLAVAALASFTPTEMLQAAKPPSTDVALAIEYRDAVGDGVRSDGLPSRSGLAFDYVHGAADNVMAILQASSGNYRFGTVLDTAQPAVRSLCLDFAGQAAPFTTVCDDMLQSMHPEFGATADRKIQDLRFGQSVKKRTQIKWVDESNAYEYYLRFAGDFDGDFVADTPPVTVTCVGPTNPSLPCAVWTMTPDGVAALARVKRLNPAGTKLGPLEVFGYGYNMPFLVTMTKR